MTVLAIRTDTTSALNSLDKLTPAEKAIHAAYVKAFKRRGFCQLADASSSYMRLFNRFDKRVLPECFISGDFRRWLRKTRQECRPPSTGYVMAGLTLVVGSKFVPKDVAFVTDPQSDLTFVNTYVPYKTEVKSKDVSPLFLEFFNRLFPDKEERHTVLQWLAHIFQRPWERPSWHVMLTSEPGTGKGFLLQDILHPLLRHTSVVADYSKVMGRFSGVLEDNLLVLLDDCKAKSDATQTQLKSLLSEERAYVERKNIDGGMVNTYTRFILASNEDKPLHLEASERRWFVPARLVHWKDEKGSGDRKTTQAFIQKLADWLSSRESLCKVYNWFMSYPLDGFNSKCVPDSAGLLAVIKASKNPYVAFIEGYVAENKVFTYTDMVDALKADGLTKPSDGHLVHLLREAGYEKSQPRINGKPKRLCHPVGMSADDIRAIYVEPESAF